MPTDAAEMETSGDAVAPARDGPLRRLLRALGRPWRFLAAQSSSSPTRRIVILKIAPRLRRLVLPTGTQARIYDREGALLLDSRNLYGRGDVLRFDLVPVDDRPSRLERAWIAVKNWFGRVNLPLYRDLGPTNGKGYPEVVQALSGTRTSEVRANDRGEIIVLVAVPIQRFRAVRGVLLLSTQGGEIDSQVAAERLQVFTLFVVLGGVMVLLSMLLARTIAGPVRRLAEGAGSGRRRVKARAEFPDVRKRRSQIG